MAHDFRDVLNLKGGLLPISMEASFLETLDQAGFIKEILPNVVLQIQGAQQVLNVLFLDLKERMAGILIHVI